jgi:hypothetical protein
MGYAVELQSKRLEVYVQCNCGWMLQGMQRWWYMHKHRNQGGKNVSKMHMCSVVMNWAELLFLEINATTTKAVSSSSQSWKEDPTLLKIACLLATFLQAVLQDENQHPKKTNKQTNKNIPLLSVKPVRECVWQNGFARNQPSLPKAQLCGRQV